MKIVITMKDPDGVWESLSEEGLDPNDLPDEVNRVVGKFFEYGEYVRIEIDTETRTAEVLAN